MWHQSSLVFRAAILLVGCAGLNGDPLRAAERAFAPLPPSQVSFNYPPPPQEGAPGFFSIAVDGQARCVVVRPEAASRSHRAAISSFARYLELVTGARIHVQSDARPVPEGLGAIHVGETQRGRKVALDLPLLRYRGATFPNLRGFLVRTIDRHTLVIRGVDTRATEHGLVGVLKRYLGVRQYWFGEPGGPGDVIPKPPTLALPELEWRDWPYFASFQMSLRGFGRRPYLDFYRRAATLPSGENYDRWLRPSQYAAAHPEYYALVNGRRLQPKDEDGSKGWQPCVSNPDVQRVMGQAVIEYFRANPTAPGINFSINDGGGDCTCAGCRALDSSSADYARRTGMSDRYVFLSNRVCEQVAREFPDKWIVYLGYASAATAPQRVKPHPMLLPVLTTPNTFQRWDEWVCAGVSHLGHYTHHNDTFALLPKLDVHQQAKRIRYIVSSDRARTYYMEAHTQWPYADVVPWITSELLWDPRLDVEDLLDEYFRQFYGAAAPAMRAYYGILERDYERWLAMEGTPHWHGRDISSYHQNKYLDQFRVLRPESAARAWTRLEEAARLAANEPSVQERLAIIRGGFGLQRLAVDRAWATFRLRDAQPRSPADAEAIVADARLVYGRSRQARDYIVNTMEQPPLARWKLFRNSTKPLAMYEELKSGEPGSQVRAAVSAGLFAAEGRLRRELGGSRAAAWWRGQKDSEKVPALIAAFAAAEDRAGRPLPKNLLADAGFETGGERVLGEKELRELGIHLTFPDRTPYRCAITREQARSGGHSLVLEHCARARYSRHIRAEPGARYRAGIWFRHNDGLSRSYVFNIDARLRDGSYRNLASMRLPDDPDNWRQYVAEVTAPTDAVNLFLRVLVENQSVDAQCWIDDVFIDR